HQPFFQQNIVFKTVFNGRLEALLPVFFGLGAIGLAQNPHGTIEAIREGFADFRARFVPPPEPAAAAAAPAAPAAASPGARPVAFPNGRTYHRPSCPLCTGKDARPVAVSRARRLERCPVCEPPAPPPPKVRRVAQPRP